jgi:hypothetical protein
MGPGFQFDESAYQAHSIQRVVVTRTTVQTDDVAQEPVGIQGEQFLPIARVHKKQLVHGRSLFTQSCNARHLRKEDNSMERYAEVMKRKEHRPGSA